MARTYWIKVRFMQEQTNFWFTPECHKQSLDDPAGLWMIQQADKSMLHVRWWTHGFYALAAPWRILLPLGQPHPLLHCLKGAASTSFGEPMFGTVQRKNTYVTVPLGANSPLALVWADASLPISVSLASGRQVASLSSYGWIWALGYKEQHPAVCVAEFKRCDDGDISFKHSCHIIWHFHRKSWISSVSSGRLTEPLSIWNNKGWRDSLYRTLFVQICFYDNCKTQISCQMSVLHVEMFCHWGENISNRNLTSLENSLKLLFAFLSDTSLPFFLSCSKIETLVAREHLWKKN